MKAMHLRELLTRISNECPQFDLDKVEIEVINATGTDFISAVITDLHYDKESDVLSLEVKTTEEEG